MGERDFESPITAFASFHSVLVLLCFVFFPRIKLLLCVFPFPVWGTAGYRIRMPFYDHPRLELGTDKPDAKLVENPTPDPLYLSGNPSTWIFLKNDPPHFAVHSYQRAVKYYGRLIQREG